MKIAVLSTNPRLYSTRRLVEAGKKRGHNIGIINPSKCVLQIEQNNPVVVYNGEKLRGIDAVIPRIGASLTFFGTAVVRHFEMQHIFSAVEAQALVKSRDKFRALQLLSRSGLGMPKTIFSNYTRDSEAVVKLIDETPIILKLLEGTQGVGVVLAETRKAAASVLEAFNGLEARVVLQEFVKESNGADIRALVVDGKVVGAMRRQAKEGEFRSNLHRGGTAKVIKLDQAEEEAAVKAAEVMGLGVAGVDLLQSDRGPLILEVNSSPGLEGIEKATGKDIATSIIEYVERNG